MKTWLIKTAFTLVILPLPFMCAAAETMGWTNCSANYYSFLCPMDILDESETADREHEMLLKSKDSNFQLNIRCEFDMKSIGWEGEYARRLNSLKDVRVTYKICTKRYFVITGFRDDKVYYLRTIPTMEDGFLIFVNFEVIFPNTEKKTWDPILTVCAKSLKPAQPLLPVAFYKPLTILTNEEWDKRFRVIRVGDEELSVLGTYLNVSEKERVFLKEFFEHPLYLEHGGNGLLSLEDRAYDEGNTKKEREDAQKELKIRNDEIVKQNRDALIQRNDIVKNLRVVLRGRDEDFSEWVFEDKQIGGLLSHLNKISQSEADALVVWAGNRQCFNEEEAADCILRNVENSHQFQIFKRQKIKALKNTRDTEEYFGLWKSLIKLKMALIYKPIKLSRLSDMSPMELRGNLHRGMRMMKSPKKGNPMRGNRGEYIAEYMPVEEINSLQEETIEQTCNEIIELNRKMSSLLSE